MAQAVEESVDLRPLLRKVGAGARRASDLSLDEARQAGDMILSGRADPAQVGAFLIALRIKGETPEEIAGVTLSIRSHLVQGTPVSDAWRSIPTPLVECAAAYDGRIKTIPVGVAAAIVADAAGVHCLFHGARGLGRSGIGPADIVGGLRCATGPTYVDQAVYSPALSALKGLRNSLGLRTVFNTAEKLVGLATDGSGPRALVLGVFHGGYLPIAAGAASLLGIPRALVIQGLEGSDDITIARDTRACEVRHGYITTREVDLGALGIRRHPASDLALHDLTACLAALRSGLGGQPGPVSEAIALNVGMRLYLADAATSLYDGVCQARDLLAARMGAL